MRSRHWFAVLAVSAVAICASPAAAEKATDTLREEGSDEPIQGGGLGA